MKNITLSLAIIVSLASCAGPESRIPEGTALTVGGKNPVNVAVGGKTWRDALRQIGIIAVQAGSQRLVDAAVAKLLPVDQGK